MHLITFLSDFGDTDWFVPAVKGSILAINPRVHIVDVTHAIKPHDIASAAFVLRSVFHVFPKGTVHLAVIDPGVGGRRKALVVKSSGHFFVGPDNGVFSYIYNSRSRVYELPISIHASSTFHGRDVFGPAAARLSLGMLPSSLGKRIYHYSEFDFPDVVVKGRAAQGEIVYIDHFGNLITNIPHSLRISQLCIHGKRALYKRSYSTGTRHQLIVVKGSTGYYEVALNKGSACDALGAHVGAKVTAVLRVRQV